MYKLIKDKDMEIENYKRINGWINVRENPKDNQSLYDFSEYTDGIYHTLSEAYDLYNQYKKNEDEMDKLIHKVEKDVKGGKKKKAEKDIKVLLKADKKFDKKIDKCDKEMKMAKKKK